MGLVTDIKNAILTSNTQSLAVSKRFAAPTNLKIDFASASQQTIIAAPSAGYRIVIQSIFLTCLVNNTVEFFDGSASIAKAYVFGFAKDYQAGLYLSEASTFKLTASLTNQIYGQVCYYVEAV